MGTLGRKIRSLRKEKKMTQLELCAGLVTPSMISQIESDKATPSPQLLEQLAARLGVNASYFAEDMSQKTDLAHTYRKAKTLMDGENYAAAVPLFLSLTERLSPQFREDVLYTEIAQCYEHLGESDNACEAYEQVVRASLERDDVPGAVYAYHHLGHIRRRQGDASVARMYWQRAAELLRRHPDISMPLAMKIHANLGRVYYQLRDYTQALDSYRKAAVLAERYQATLDLAMIQHGIGNVLLAFSELEESERLLQSAITLYDAVRHQRGVNQCRINLGACYAKGGDYEKAIDHLSHCIDDPEIKSDSIRLANAHGERASCYLAVRMYPESIADTERAIEIDRNTPTLQAILRCTQAEAMLEAGMGAEALAVLEQAQDYADQAKDFTISMDVYHLQKRVLDGLQRRGEAVDRALKLAQLVLCPA